MAEPGLQSQGVPAPLPSSPSISRTTSQEHHAPPAQQGQQLVQLNWSHFKPEFSGKPDENA